LRKSIGKKRRSHLEKRLNGEGRKLRSGKKWAKKNGEAKEEEKDLSDSNLRGGKGKEGFPGVEERGKPTQRDF